MDTQGGMEQSQAFQDGYFIGRILGAVLVMVLVGGGGAFFIYALVKAFTRKTTGWILTAVVMGLLGFALVSMIIFGIAMGISKVVKQSDLDQVLTSRDGRYSISVPRAWKANPEPDGMTCLEARSAFPARYLTVIALDKSYVRRPLADYAEVSSRRIQEAAKNGVRSQPESLVLGSYPALRYRITGTLEESQFVYHLTFVETPEALSQISCWSLQSDEGFARPIFERVAASFMENPK